MNLIKKNNKVLVLGDFILDILISGEVKRISPEAPIPILNLKNQKITLGGAANVASNLANLGISTTFLSIISKRDNTLSKNLMKKYGIVDESIYSSNFDTIKKTRFSSNQQQLLRVDEESKNISQKDQIKIKSKLLKIINNFSYLIISDYDKGLINSIPDVIEKIISNKKLKVFVDTKRQNINIYKNSFLIKPNIHEFKKICLNYKLNHDDLKKSPLKILNKINVKYLLLTKGKDGIELFNNRSSMYNLSKPVDRVYDVTGAGDVVISSFVATFIKYQDLQIAMKIAFKLSRISVLNFGTYVVKQNELIEKSTPKKIVNIKNLKQILKENINSKIVFTNGCFDILHKGHFYLFDQAKKLGDILIVGINDDQSIKRIKGNNRPINNIEDRSYNLSQINNIDYIVVFKEDSPLKLIHKIKPHILVKGGDYKLKEIIGYDFVKQNGGQVIIIKYLKKFSTTNLIKKLNFE